MFLVVVLVPLLNRDNKFEINNVINSQLPFYDKNLTVSLQPNFVAKYKLETSALAINPERTKYIILEADELVHCSTQLLEYCNVKSSFFPVNLSKLCIVALFMKNKDNVKAYCQTEVIPNSLLPKATYVFDGIWIFAMQAELSFSIVCKNYTKVMLSKPPVSVLSLEMGCTASNDYVTLMPFYHKESTYVIWDIYSELLQLNNKSQTNLWNVFTSRLPNFTKIDIPEHLKALEKIPMGDLIETLHGLQKIEKDKGTIDWSTLLLVQ